MKIAYWIGLTALVGALATGALWGTGHLDAVASLDESRQVPAKASAKPTSTFEPPTISVIRPATRPFVETLRINGSLVAREEVLVAPQIEGQRISALLVEAGDTIKKGQLLARLATENLDALVAQNDATLQRAEAGIARAGSAITQARARLKEADAALKRAKPLSRSGYLADSTLDQRQSVATAARAALAIANNNLRVAESEQAEAKAKRRELLWRRSHTAIYAPVDGLVLSRSAKRGGIATATGEPMFRIARGGEIELEGEVTSDQLHRLKRDQSVRIDIPGQAAIKGKVRLVSPRVDPTTRLGHVRIFIGAEPGLRVGTFTTGIVKTASGHGLAVPVNAIMRDGKGPFVQVVIDDTVRTRRLTTGLTSDGYIEVRSGLTADDRVVAKAGTFLGDGERITPIEAGKASPNGKPAAARPKAG